MITDYYYYHRLNSEEQEVYKKTLSAITKRISRVDVSKYGLSKEEYLQVFRKIVFDNPALYYVDYEKVLFSMDNDKVAWFEIRFVYSAEQCSKLDGLIDKYTKSIVERAKLAEEKSPIADRIHALHDLLASNIIYDYDVMNENSKAEDVHFAHTILGVILRRKAVCDGISKAFKYLLNVAGIRCIIVWGKLKDEQGKDSSVDHAWNIVKIGEDSYHIDLTNDIKGTQSGCLCQDYYCLSDEVVLRDHSIHSDVPACSGERENFFVKNECVARSKVELEKIITEKTMAFPNNIYCRIDFDTEPIEQISEWMQNFYMEQMMKNDLKGIYFCSINPHARTVMITAKQT